MLEFSSVPLVTRWMPGVNDAFISPIFSLWFWTFSGPFELYPSKGGFRIDIRFKIHMGLVTSQSISFNNIINTIVLLNASYLPTSAAAVSWLHYTVSGFPCRKDTTCAQNVVAGHWACEPEGGEIGKWTSSPCEFLISKKWRIVIIAMINMRVGHWFEPRFRFYSRLKRGVSSALDFCESGYDFRNIPNFSCQNPHRLVW